MAGALPAGLALAGRSLSGPSADDETYADAAAGSYGFGETRGRPGRLSPAGPTERTRGAWGDDAQPVVTAVSSIRKPVDRDESSVPVNLIVTVLPLNADRSRVRWA